MLSITKEYIRERISSAILENAHAIAEAIADLVLCEAQSAAVAFRLPHYREIGLVYARPKGLKVSPMLVPTQVINNSTWEEEEDENEAYDTYWYFVAGLLQLEITVDCCDIVVRRRTE